MTFRLWGLDMPTYKGISIGATHYYPTLWGDGRYSLMRKLSGVEAVMLNKVDRLDFWKAGAVTNRFDTQHEARAAGLAAWRTMAAERDVLLAGRLRMEPERPLAGPPEIVLAIKQMYDEMAGSGFYEGSPRTYRRVLREWDAFLLEHKVDRSINWSKPEETIIVNRITGGWEVIDNETYWKDGHE